jgi:hypothetical protein
MATPHVAETGAEYQQRPELVPLSPGVPLARQIRDYALATGRVDADGEPDMSRLSWKQNGVRIEAEQSTVHPVQRVSQRRTRLPRYNYSKAFGHGFNRTATYTDEVVTNTNVRLKSYKDGKDTPDEVHDFPTSDGFFAHLDTLSIDRGRPDRITEVCWLPEPVEEAPVDTETHMHQIDVMPGQSPVGLLMGVQEHFSLEDLEGTIIARSGLTYTFVEDRTRHWTDGQKTPHTRREIVLEMTRPDGTVSGRATKTPDELEKMLGAMNNGLNEPLRIRVPVQLPKEDTGSSHEEKAWMGWTSVNETDPGINPLDDPEVVGDRDISLDDAMLLLAGVDVEGEAATRASIDELEKASRAGNLSPEDLEHLTFTYQGLKSSGEALRQAVAEHGLESVIELAKSLRDDYVDSAVRLGVEVSADKEDTSISRALLGIAEQFDLARRQRSHAGEAVINPFGDSQASKAMRRDIAEQMIGDGFSGSFIRIFEAKRPRDFQQQDGSVETKLQLVRTYQPDKDALRQVQVFFRAEMTRLVEELAQMRSDAEHGLPIDKDKQAALQKQAGRIAHRSIGKTGI